MLWLVFLAGASPSAASNSTPPTTVDVLAKPECPAAGSDVVVCGYAEDRRLQPLPDFPRSAGPPDGPLSISLPGGGTGKLRASQSDLPGGRGAGVATTLTLPF